MGSDGPFKKPKSCSLTLGTATRPIQLTERIQIGSCSLAQVFAALLFCSQGFGFHAESTVQTELDPTVSLLCEIAKFSSLADI